MNPLLNRIRKWHVPLVLGLLISIAAGSVIALIVYEPKEQHYEIYLSRESCPFLKNAGVVSENGK